MFYLCNLKVLKINYRETDQQQFKLKIKKVVQEEKKPTIIENEFYKF